MKNEELIYALNIIEEEKGVSKEIVLEALETALISTYKKNFSATQEVSVSIDRDTGKITLSVEKEIVDEVHDDENEISLEDARKINPSYELGDTYHEEIEPRDFGRIATQTVRQVVIQRIKDAERDIIYDDFVNRENEIITGEVQRVSRGHVFVDLGRTEAILPISEQIHGEDYSQGQRYKMLLLEVNRTPKGPQVVLSRSHPNLVRRLFELEVPEINDGVVEIFSIAREAGSRTKIAIFSRDEEVDPLGACVGFKGSRVKAIVDELHNEKIDIVIWENKIDEFIANALSPSKVEEVYINEEEKSALVVVPDYQLSLAIGREGQNARLAAKLTNWKIDIKSETQFEEYLDEIGMTREELRSSFNQSDENDSKDEEYFDEEESSRDEVEIIEDEIEAEDSDETLSYEEPEGFSVQLNELSDALSLEDNESSDEDEE